MIQISLRIINFLLHNALTKQWIKHQTNLNNLVEHAFTDKPKVIPETETFQYINVGSTPQCIKLLYEELGFRERRHRSGENKGKVTTDEAAIISMITEAKKEFDSKVREDAKNRWRRKLIILKLIWIIRGVRKKQSSYTGIEMSPDGRCRSLFKLGPETGRWSAEKWLDKTGMNMQTLPRDGVEVEDE